MEIDARVDGKTVVLNLSGKLQGVDFQSFCKNVEDYKDSNYARIIIDLSNVLYIDSVAIGALIYLNRFMKKSAIEFVLRGPNEQIVELFRECSLDRLFTIEDSIVPK